MKKKDFKNKLLPSARFETEEEKRPLSEEEKPTKKDYLAMFLSAMLTIFLPCVLILVAIVLVVMLMFGAF